MTDVAKLVFGLVFMALLVAGMLRLLDHLKVGGNIMAGGSVKVG